MQTPTTTEETVAAPDPLPEPEPTWFPPNFVNATYLNSFNYFCGLQINVRES